MARTVKSNRWLVIIHDGAREVAWSERGWVGPKHGALLDMATAEQIAARIRPELNAKVIDETTYFGD